MVFTLGTQLQELSAIANGWSLALRTAQIREEARSLAEQLAESNRRLLFELHEKARQTGCREIRSWIPHPDEVHARLLKRWQTSKAYLDSVGIPQHPD